MNESHEPRHRPAGKVCASSWSTTITSSSPGCGPSSVTRWRSWGTPTRWAAAIELIGERVPDVVLVDVHMPDGGGQAVIEAIGRTHPEVRFLALSVSDAAEDVIGVIRAGAAATSPRPSRAPSSPTRSSGWPTVMPCSRPGWPGSCSTPSPPDPGAAGGAVPTFDPELDQLTPREREVLRLIARGYAYKEVARQLSISVKTVESHVSAVLRKLQLSSRHQLTRWASSAGCSELRQGSRADS